jgi:hypothetical protein
MVQMERTVQLALKKRRQCPVMVLELCRLFPRELQELQGPQSVALLVLSRSEHLVKKERYFCLQRELMSRLLWKELQLAVQKKQMVQRELLQRELMARLLWKELQLAVQREQMVQKQLLHLRCLFLVHK